MFCFHKWEKPVERYQTCSKCGKVRVVKCAHHWKVIKTIVARHVRTDTRLGEILILQCQNCGEITEYKTFDYPYDRGD